MASEWAKAKALDVCDHLHNQHGGCGLCADIAAALDEARAEGEAKATAKLHDLLSGVAAALDPDEHSGLQARLGAVLSCDGPGPCRQYAQDLTEAEQRGAERERWACHQIALHHSEPGRASELTYHLIAARGPMRGPEEE